MCPVLFFTSYGCSSKVLCSLNKFAHVCMTVDVEQCFGAECNLSCTVEKPVFLEVV